MTARGPAVNFGGSNYFYSALPLQPPVSQLYVLVHGANSVIGGSGIGSSSSANRTQWDTYGTSGRFRAITVDNGGGVVSAESGITPATDAICAVICTAAANGSVQVFFGGTKASASASTSFGQFTRSYIGAIAFDPPNNFYADPILLSASWGRVLADEEAYAILDRPAQLVRPVSRRRFFLPSAGGGGATGSFAVTESGSDTADFDGLVKVAGSFAVTEAGSDTSDIDGLVKVSGSYALTESGSDSALFEGYFPVEGIPTLTSATVTAVTRTTATPRVTITFP